MGLFSIKIATAEDYTKLQGGIPEVKIEDGLTVVTHKYPKGEGMEVRSHIDHGTVIINNTKFKVDLLRKFHCEPCEKNSKLVGGKGYDRKD